MKFFLLFLTFTLTLFAAHIDDFALNMGYEREFDKALAQAKKENKMVMLVLVGDYCPWCRKFERKTLQNATTAIMIQKNFIPVIVDKNLDKDKYPEKYFTSVVPTVRFIEPKKDVEILESSGYKKVKEYEEILNKVLLQHKGGKS